MPERPWATICFPLMFGVIIFIWAAYGIADVSSQDTFKCNNEGGLKSNQNMNHDLPGGGHDPKFAMNPWSIGQRDFFWFLCSPQRCALPAIFSKAKDLCIDRSYRTDRHDAD